MANLLPKTAARPPCTVLEAERLVRLENRVRGLSRFLGGGGAPGVLSASHQAFAGIAAELAELEESPSPDAAHALLHTIDGVRGALLAAAPVAESAPSGLLFEGDWLCYAPGRSLATGEAEIASQGFFDELDRPPIGLWLEALTRPAQRRMGAFELLILCWIPAAWGDRARAGQRAAASGSLAFVDEVAPLLADQLRGLGLREQAAEAPVGS